MTVASIPMPPFSAQPVAVVATAECAACGEQLPVDRMEPIPTRPDRLRCTDARACTRRFTPTRQA